MEGNDMPTDANESPERKPYGPYTSETAEKALEKTPEDRYIFDG